MLSNLAGFLLWGGAEDQQNLEGYSVDTQEDWVIVSKGEGREEELSDRLPTLNIECQTDLISEGESSAQTLSPATEGAWCVAPPPCFTRTTTSALTTSSLEDLLIEHPSMSIYQRRRRRGSTGSSDEEEAAGDVVINEQACLCLCFVDTEQTLSETAGVYQFEIERRFLCLVLCVPEGLAQAVTTSSKHQAIVAPETDVWPSEVETEEQEVQQQEQVQPIRDHDLPRQSTTQHYLPTRTKRKEAKNNQKALKRGQLERNNKAREYQARGKHQRRTHLMRMRYSGVCNDRRC